jgi:hypothetical protein
LENLGWVELRAGNLPAAREDLLQALAGYRSQQVAPLGALTLLAVLEARSGRQEAALEWIGILRTHPTLYPGSIEFLLSVHWEEITAGLSAAVVEAALARGAQRSLHDLMQDLESQGEKVGSAGA